MIEDFYSNIQFAVCVLLLATGIHLLIGKVPGKPVFETYRKSRKIMGGAFLVFCMQFFIQWIFNARDAFPLAASALNITFFYLSTVMVGFSFISLLNEKFINRRRTVTHLSLWAATSTAVWLSIAFLPRGVSIWVLILAAAGFFIYVGHLSWIFFKTYRSAVQKIRNYHSEDVDGFIRWISKSVFFSIVMGLLSSVMAFAPKWMITIYLAVGIPFFYYIFVCFLDYLINYEMVDNAIDEESETEALNVQADKTLTYEQIEERLQDWISAKGYLQPKINLGEIALQIGSNRSYLSGFINTRYGCTYYKWIALLRIQEAKKLMIDRPELTISQIVEKAGFSSNPHFTTLFTKEEGLPPTQWREKYP